MENGFSSPRSESFPAGLRVLVVDDDPTWLKILEKMLKKCFYEVTTCGLARDALSLLRERKDGYDIVISDVNMPDMDGFKLLEHVGLEMDLPVIMMSVDGETSRVMKGVQHGACDYLLKPIRMKELRNIWQHVFRKKIHEIRDIESYDTYESLQISRNGSDLIDDGHMFSGEDLASMKKRKDFDNKHDDKDFGDPTATKKHRVVWSVDLHQKFVKAVNQIGFDKVGPKKILDLMNVPWLTRENVASHLQKYRLYLSRLQKENDLKASFGGVKHSDIPSKDFGVQNSINKQIDIANGRLQFSGNNLVGQNVDIKSHEGDIKVIVSEPVAEPNQPVTADVSDPQKTTSQISFDSFTSLESKVAYDCTIPTKYAWSTVQEIELEQEDKPHLQLEDDFRQLPPHGPQHQIQSIPSIASGLSLTGGDIGSMEIKPSYAEYKSNHLSHVSPTGSAIDTFPVLSKMENHHSFESISTISSMKPQGINLSCIPDMESCPKNLISANESSFAPFEEDWTLRWLQGDYNGFTDCPGFIAGVPIHLYDALTSDYECPFDPVEYPLIDQGLFIV